MSDEMKVPPLPGVNRFAFGPAGMADCVDGSYVRYTDYAALQQQLAAAREALQVAEAECARYRAMRHAGWGKGASRDLWFDILRAETPDQLDAAIDATLQRDRQP